VNVGTSGISANLNVFGDATVTGLFNPNSLQVNGQSDLLGPVNVGTSAETSTLNIYGAATVIGAADDTLLVTGGGGVTAGSATINGATSTQILKVTNTNNENPAVDIESGSLHIQDWTFTQNTEGHIVIDTDGEHTLHVGAVSTSDTHLHVHGALMLGEDADTPIVNSINTSGEVGEWSDSSTVLPTQAAVQAFVESVIVEIPNELNVQTLTVDNRAAVGGAISLDNAAVLAAYDVPVNGDTPALLKVTGRASATTPPVFSLSDGLEDHGIVGLLTARGRTSDGSVITPGSIEIGETSNPANLTVNGMTTLKETELHGNVTIGQVGATADLEVTGKLILDDGDTEGVNSINRTDDSWSDSADTLTTELAVNGRVLEYISEALPVGTILLWNQATDPSTYPSIGTWTKCDGSSNDTPDLSHLFLHSEDSPPELLAYYIMRTA
jgi:hypothetical protein